MLIEHVTQNLIHPIKREELRNSLQEAVTIFDDVRSIRDCLISLQNEEIAEEDATQEIETLAVFAADNLNKFKCWKSSSQNIVNKYLEGVINDLAYFSQNLTIALDSMFMLSSQELQLLIDIAYRVISGMLFFCLVEFDLFGLAGTTDSNDVDEVVQDYCNFNYINPKTFAKRLVDFSTEYKIRIELFDSVPELEDAFYTIMGPHIVGVQTENLTVDLVRQVITGAISVEDLINLTNISEDDMEEANG